ncbi:hypothetical protein GH733_016899 [Mirounga leonina]|nr:hypothetical protein GH733_016899 [Mirounga leonina]
MFGIRKGLLDTTGYVLGTEIAGAGDGQPKLDLKGFRPKTPSRTREFSPGPRVSEMSWNRKVSSLSSGTGKDLANKSKELQRGKKKLEMVEIGKSGVTLLCKPDHTSLSGKYALLPTDLGMKTAVILALIGCLVTATEPKVYTRCKLAKIFSRAGLDNYQGFSLGNWICMAYFESHYNTTAQTELEDGSIDYGIFRINSFTWCRQGKLQEKNHCHVACAGTVLIVQK